MGKMVETSSIQLKAFALNLTHDPVDAEDLYQESIYLALKNRDKFLEGTNFVAWMKTIIRNTFINGYRRKKRFMDYVNDKVNVMTSAPALARNSAESDMLIKELTAIIDEVEPQFKTPFLMFYQGLPYEEIAEELGIPLGTVKSRIFIARRKIKQAYEQLYGEHEVILDNE